MRRTAVRPQWGKSSSTKQYRIDPGHMEAWSTAAFTVHNEIDGRPFVYVFLAAKVRVQAR